MHRFRRLIAWTFLLGLLAAAGVCVFGYVSYSPRCTIGGSLFRVHLSADGSRLVTLGPRPGQNWRGPVQLWDTHSGRVVHEWFDGADVMRFEIAAGDRHAAVVLGDGRVRLLDFRTGKEWRFDEPPKDEAANRADFSPGGRWLFVVTARCETLYVIDAHTCEVTLRIRDNWPVVSRDDKLLFYRQYPDRKITVWDLEEGKARGVVPATANLFDISADGRLLLERHTEPIPPPPDDPGDPGHGGGVRKEERKDYRIAVWDVATGRRLFQHEMPRRGDLQSMYSPDGRFLACWLREEEETSPLQVLDARTGKLLWSHPMKRGYNFDFSSDGSLCHHIRRLEHHPLKANHHLTMFDAATGQVLWERPAGGNTYFARNTPIFLHQDEFDLPLHFLDARTGVPLATMPLNFPTANYIPMLTRDGGRFVIGGWQERGRAPYFWEKWLAKRWPQWFGDELEGCLVMDTTTGGEVFRVVGRAKDSYALSDDGETLVTIDPAEGPGRSVVIRVWDMGTRRAWVWAGGAIVACVVVLFTLSRIVRCWRDRRKPAPTHSTG